LAQFTTFALVSSSVLVTLACFQKELRPAMGYFGAALWGWTFSASASAWLATAWSIHTIWIGIALLERARRTPIDDESIADALRLRHVSLWATLTITLTLLTPRLW